MSNRPTDHYRTVNRRNDRRDARAARRIAKRNGGK